MTEQRLSSIAAHPIGATPNIKPVFPSGATQAHRCEMALQRLGRLNPLSWLAALLLASAMAACAADTSKDGIGVGITGIDHLDDYLSVQNFWVNGYNAAQAGNGGSTVCCAILPRKWQKGMKVRIRWEVADWKSSRWACYVRDVPVEPYEEVGQLWVHFMKDGSVRAVSSDEGPRSPTYPGPHDVISRKHPWKDYPPLEADETCHDRAETQQ